VDSLISILGQGHLVIEASRQRKAGKSAEETAAYIESIRLNVNMMGYPGSLEYLRRAGRVKASSAFFGNLFGVKPIIISDRQGNNYALKKVKGMANARNTVAEMTQEAMTEGSDTLYIAHADCPEEAEVLKNVILSRCSFKEVRTGVIGPIVGASVGPGTVAAFILGKEVTIEGND
jgi:DegV family protein with EDD domain